MSQEKQSRTPLTELPAVEQEVRIQPVRNGWLVKSNEGWFAFTENAPMLSHVAELCKSRRGK